jgi:Ion transport protein
VSRLLKLSKNLEGLQKILDTMVLSFPSMMNIGALTLLAIYIYSVLACYLFGKVTSG